MHTHYLAAKKQKGMTMIGIVLMFLVVGFLLLAILRIFPLYYENLSVQTALDGLVKEYSESPAKLNNKKKLQTSLQRRLDGQDVVSLKAEDVKVKKSRNGFTVDASYKPVANYLGNFNFMVEFEHVIELEK